MTADALASRQINNSLNLEAAVPNLTLPQNGVSVTPFLHGVGSSQSNPNDEPSVATYIDGVYIPSVTGNVFSFNKIERIEVLKGPQGTLFGRNATGGVIQIVTRDPDPDRAALNVSLGAGNYGIMEGRGYGSAPLGGAAAIDLAVVYDSNNGFGKNLTLNQRIFRKEQIGLRSKLVIALGPDTKVKIAGDYSHLDSSGADYQLARGVIGADGVSTYPGRRNTINEFANKGNNEIYGASVRLDHDFHALRFASISAYRHVRGLFALDQDATPAPIVRADIHQLAENKSQEIQFFAPQGSKIDWLIGGFFFDAKFAYDPLTIGGLAADATFANPNPSISLFGNQGTRSYAVYGQATVPLTSTTKLTGGLRWTHDRQKTNGYTAVGVFIVPHAPNPLCPGAVADYPQQQSVGKITWRVAIDQQFSEDILGYLSYRSSVIAIGTARHAARNGLTHQDAMLGWISATGVLSLQEEYERPLP